MAYFISTTSTGRDTSMPPMVSTMEMNCSKSTSAYAVMLTPENSSTTSIM